MRGSVLRSPKAEIMFSREASESGLEVLVSLRPINPRRRLRLLQRLGVWESPETRTD